jgi:histidine triad (HIT) family protein
MNKGQCINGKKLDCLFCDIAASKAPSAKLMENQDFIAILDPTPNMRGVTRVLTKKHYPTDAFEMPDEEYHAFLAYAKEVSRLLKAGLNVKRVALVMECVGVDHTHIKLYPLKGDPEAYTPFWARERVFIDDYAKKGYITTQLGPLVNMPELEKLASKIRRKIGFTH